MKAILVLDEMPVDCGDCYMRGEDCEKETPICLCSRLAESVWKYTDGERPEWCPLRPMPERKELRPSDMTHARMVKQGWNACLGELEASP